MTLTVKVHIKELLNTLKIAGSREEAKTIVDEIGLALKQDMQTWTIDELMAGMTFCQAELGR